MAIRNLPTYHLHFHPLDLFELRSDIWSEVPVQATLKNRKKKLQVDVVYRGSHIRKFKKKSYHIQFYKPKTFKGVKELHLNSEFNDPSLLRNKLSLDFFSQLGILSPKSHHMALNINSNYEGVYLALESVDEHFLKDRCLPPGAIYYAVNDDANFSLMSEIDQDVKKSLKVGYERKCGHKADDLALEKFIYNINSTPPAKFEEMISKHLHVEQYLKWLAGIVCVQNFDGFVHNYALYYNRKNHLFQLIPWDYDATWGRDVNGKDLHPEYVRIEGFNTLSARLLAVPTYRRHYHEILTSILETEFTTRNMETKISSLQEQICPYVQKDPYLKDKAHMFLNEAELILTFIKKRNAYLKKELKKLQ
ncbi:CotH kinase family protein [Bacillus spongiae]|uniref:CotH kinase family protein n=1 Tax=Bacillus spongiae TaxID=2683610 RepID=A0ABU8HFG4_9BACI